MAALVQLPGIDGESTIKGHEKWIEVNAVSLPIHRSIQPDASGPERQNGETTVGDIVVTKASDSSTPKLAAYCASGKFLDTVSIHMCSNLGGNTVVNLEIKLSNVVVSSYSYSASGSASPPPSEVISLNYTKIEWTYHTYDEMGNDAGQVPASFDSETTEVTGN